MQHNSMTSTLRPSAERLQASGVGKPVAICGNREEGAENLLQLIPSMLVPLSRAQASDQAVAGNAAFREFIRSGPPGMVVFRQLRVSPLDTNASIALAWLLLDSFRKQLLWGDLVTFAKRLIR